MPKIEAKKVIVDEIKAKLDKAGAVILVDARGLTVEQDTQLRKHLRETGVDYKVYKNTLVSRAVEGTEFESLRDVLEGPSAFAVSTEDATAPARVLAEFAKKAPKLEMKAGVVEGTFYDAEGIKAISTIPSREVLLSKLLGNDHAGRSRGRRGSAGRRCSCSRGGPCTGSSGGGRNRRITVIVNYNFKWRKEKWQS